MELRIFSGSSKVIRDTRALWLAEIEIWSPRPECEGSSASDFRDGVEDRGWIGSGNLRRRESMNADFLFCVMSEYSMVGAVVMMVGAITSQLGIVARPFDRPKELTRWHGRSLRLIFGGLGQLRVRRMSESHNAEPLRPCLLWQS